MSEITRDTLMAYCDTQLDAATRSAVETHIAAHPEAAAELAQMQRQSDAIRTLYGPTVSEPIPSRLDPHRLVLVANRRRAAGLARAAMIVALIGIGMATGWFLRPTADAPAIYDHLIADAVSAHTVYVAENRHAVEVAGTDSDHLSTWLSNRLSTHLAMPDLAAEGFSFLGGRLLPAPEIAGGRAAQLMYQDNAGKRLTLYVTPATGVSGPAYETVQFGVDTALYWANEVFTCTIVGDQPVGTLKSVAQAAIAQLSPDRPPPQYQL